MCLMSVLHVDRQEVLNYEYFSGNVVIVVAGAIMVAAGMEGLSGNGSGPAASEWYFRGESCGHGRCRRLRIHTPKRFLRKTD